MSESLDFKKLCVGVGVYIYKFGILWIKNFYNILNLVACFTARSSY